MLNMFKVTSFQGAHKLLIHDVIGFDGVTSSQVIESLSYMEGPITVSINSAGGSVADGLAIYNALKDYDGTVNIEVTGLAASMGSIIAMAGDTISMPESALMMIHWPWVSTTGNAKQLQKTAESLIVAGQTMAAIYQAKTSLSPRRISSMLDEETWMNGKDAYELGFTTNLATSIQVNDEEVKGFSSRLLECRIAEIEIAASEHAKTLDETSQAITNAHSSKPRRDASPKTRLTNYQSQYFGIKNV